MSTCQSCGHVAEPDERFCVECGKPIAAGSGSPAVPGGSPPGDWVDFSCWDGTFSLWRPADWKPLDPPASDGASLSCAGPGGYKLLEAFSYQRTGPVPPGSPDIVSITADGLKQTLGQEAGHANVKFHRCEDVAFPGVEHAMRVVVSYTDQGLETTTDHLLAGDKRNGVMIAFKVLSPDYEALLPLFERVVASLRTTWPRTGKPEHIANYAKEPLRTPPKEPRPDPAPANRKLSKEERQALIEARRIADWKSANAKRAAEKAEYDRQMAIYESQLASGEAEGKSQGSQRATGSGFSFGPAEAFFPPKRGCAGCLMVPLGAAAACFASGTYGVWLAAAFAGAILLAVVGETVVGRSR